MAPAGTLRLVLEVPDTVRAGDPVPITLRVTNPGEEPVELHLRGQPIAFDVIVEASDGSPVWRRLEGRVVPAVLQVRTLAPGDSLTLHTQWEGLDRDGDPAPPGVYTLRGTLPELREGPLETPPATVRLLPPDG